MNRAERLAEIYCTDLVYLPDCWRLCGDAHCCHFSRLKAKFGLVSQKHFQQLPLLPGEYAFLEQQNWLAQFQNPKHHEHWFPVGPRMVKAESLVSYRPHCACDHDTRTTICRLYPLMPVFDAAGRVEGVDSVAVFDDLEQVEGTEPLCQIRQVPIPQLGKFLKIAGLVAGDPLWLFYALGYRLIKQHVREQVAAMKQQWPAKSAFALFQGAVLMRRLMNEEYLRSSLGNLAAEFSQRFGREFDDALETVTKKP